MSWDNMSEQERYYRRLNNQQASEDMAGWSALGLIIGAIVFIFFAAQGVFLFIGSYFVIISSISGAFIGLSWSKESLAEDPSDPGMTYIIGLILGSLFFGVISYFLKAWFFPEVDTAFREFLSSWGF